MFSHGKVTPTRPTKHSFFPIFAGYLRTAILAITTAILVFLMLGMLFPTSVSGAIYAPDRCGQTTFLFNPKSQTYTYGNLCLSIFGQGTQYDPYFVVTNHLDNNEFKFSYYEIAEQDTTGRAISVVSFKETILHLDTTADHLRFVSKDNKFVVGYYIRQNTIESYVTVAEYPYTEEHSFLSANKIIEKSKERDTIAFYAPIVDNYVKEVEYSVSEKVLDVGEKNEREKVYTQVLGRGEYIYLDPIYIVDYSPVPANYLYPGVVASITDSAFPNSIDVTSGVSDNNTATSYRVFQTTTTNVTDFSFFNIATNRTSFITAIDGSAHRVNHDWSSKYARIAVPGGLTNGSVIKLYWKAKDASNANKPLYLHNSAGTTTYATTTSGSASYHWENISLDISGTITEVYISDLTNGGTVETDYDFIHILNPNDAVGRAITARWSNTYSSLYDWFVRVYKVDTGTHTLIVEAYNTSDALAGRQSVATLVGDGYFNINVTSLMQYETNVRNLTFTQFRFYTTNPANLSEIFLRAEVNDTTPPVIDLASCRITNAGTGLEDSTFGCLETIEFECNITDDLDIATAYAIINGQSYQMNQRYGGQLHYDLYITPTLNGTITYTWTQVNATDISGLTTTYSLSKNATYTCIYEDYINITHYPVPGQDILNLTNTSVSLRWTTSHPASSQVDYGITGNPTNESAYLNNNATTHSIHLSNLLSNTTYDYYLTSSVNPEQTLGPFQFTTLTGCIEQWVENPYTCSINDTYISTYTDANACDTTLFLPPTNGTEQYCNYCSADMVTIIGECSGFGTQVVSYVDNNYASCCAVTGLLTDCPTQYPPYNETITQQCEYFNNTMGNIYCQKAPHFKPGDKQYCLASLPTQYLHNETFKCIVKISDPVTFEIYQTNPEYRERTTTLIDFRPDPETRTYFEPANGLVNFYYTDKNLHPEKEYSLRILCSSSERTLESGMSFQIRYEDWSGVFYRSVWWMQNFPYIIGLLILAFFILSALFLWWKAVRP